MPRVSCNAELLGLGHCSMQDLLGLWQLDMQALLGCLCDMQERLGLGYRAMQNCQASLYAGTDGPLEP